MKCPFAGIRGRAPNSDASHLLQNYAARSAPPITNNLAVGGAVSSRQTVEYQQTNPTVNAHVLVCPRTDQRERFLKEGDIVFINTTKTPRGPLSNRSRPPVDVANLQMINAEASRRQQGVVQTRGNEADIRAARGEIQDFFKQWQLLGVIEAITQLNGGCPQSNLRRVDLMLSVQVRGRSVRLQNHWPNSRPLDQLGFAVLPIAPCDAGDEHSACNFIPRYAVYGKDGFCTDNALGESIVAEARGNPDYAGLQFTAVLNGDPVDVQQRRKVELALRDTASEVRQGYMFLMMPVNLTYDAVRVQDHAPVSHYFGVMSDRFHQPAPSTSDVMPGLVNLDERLGHGGICKRQCEVLINVA